MRVLERWFASILAGLRHVALPDAPPDKVEIVRDGTQVEVQIEYAGTTVRHEFEDRVERRI